MTANQGSMELKKSAREILKECRRFACYGRTFITVKYGMVMPLTNNGEKGLMPRIGIDTFLQALEVPFDEAKKIFPNRLVDGKSIADWSKLGSFHHEDMERWQAFANLTGKIIDVFFDISDGTGCEYQYLYSVNPFPTTKIIEEKSSD